jgi:putative transposase
MCQQRKGKSMPQIIVLQYALDPTPAQEQAFSSHAGAVRYAYNWALARIKKNWSERKANPDTSYIDHSMIGLRKVWNQEKHNLAPWYSENSKEAYDSGLRNLSNAVNRCYKKVSGQPNYKHKKYSDTEGIAFTTGTRYLDLDTKRHFAIPRIGRVRLHERARKLAWLLAQPGSSMGMMTLKRSQARWHLSINIRVTDETWVRYHNQRTKRDKKKVVGVDVGIKHAAVFSDGTVIENKRYYEKILKKLRKFNKQLSRRRKYNKTTGEVPSNRYLKTKSKLAKAHARVSSQEIDYAHKLSKQLVDNYEIIGLEDLNVAGMVKNGRLSRRIAHASFGRLRRFATYKAGWYGSKVVLVDRFYPSSKICSDCGAVKAKLSLSERSYNCSGCGLIVDRDLNAALNIRNNVARSCGETLNGRGGGSAGLYASTSETIPSETISQALLVNS